jgi:hypothetical protein
MSKLIIRHRSEESPPAPEACQDNSQASRTNSQIAERPHADAEMTRVLKTRHCAWLQTHLTA